MHYIIAELKLGWWNIIFFTVFTEIHTYLLRNNNNLFCSITLRSLQIDLNKTSTVKKRYNKQVFSYLLWNILEKQRKYFCIFECKILLSWRNRKRFFTTFLLLSLDRQSSCASYLDGFFGKLLFSDNIGFKKKLLHVLDSSSIWTCGISNFEYLLMFFQAGAVEKSQNKCSIFEIQHV